MSNRILENNLKLISKYNRNLAEKIANISDLQANYEIKEAKSGDSILFMDGVPVDNPMDPVWDAVEKYNNLKDKTKKGITVLYGFGVGYILKDFANRYAGKVIVYEPNVEILRIVLELVDFSQELDNRNVRITSDYEEVKKAYLELFFKDYALNLVPLYFYEKADPKFCAEFKEEIEKIHGVYQSNYRNLMEKSHWWTFMLFYNIPQVLNYQDLHSLKGCYKGKTAVIISAGPSLDKNIEDLKPYRDKVVVFCVGTALRTAIMNGIIPDFVVSIEISPNTKKQLDVPELSEMKLIAATNAYSGIFELKPKCFLNYHLNKDAASQWLGGLLNAPMEEYESAGTVSIIALYSAKMMGADKIIFIGQDLAYTDNQCYTQSSLYGGYRVEEGKNIALQDAETTKKNLGVDDNTITNQMKVLSNGLYYIKGHNNKRVLSRSDLMLFIFYFEEIAENLGDDIKFVNSTEGGAYIKGFEHIPLKESLEKYAGGAPFEKDLNTNITKLTTKDLKKRKKLLIQELRALVKNMHEAGNIVADAVNSHVLPCLSEESNNLYKEIWDFFPEVFANRNVFILTKRPVKKEYLDWHEKHHKLFENLKNEITNLIKERPEIFSKSLKGIKDNYFPLKDIVYKNVFLKNMSIFHFLVIDNQIKDFENTDENLINLFYIISQFLLIFNMMTPEYNKFLKSLIQRIES